MQRITFKNAILTIVSSVLPLAFLCTSTVSCQDANSYPSEKPRVIVSTDIGGTDPDDFQSMIHYLMYADRFTTEGLIASPYGEGRTDDIHSIINLYEEDFPKLSRHADFPTADQLRSVVKQGAIRAADPRGWNTPSEGSQWIIERAKVNAVQPLWILVWGGLEDVAQALHDAPEIREKIRIYWIGGPNKKWSVHAYQYLARHFPDVFMIEANATYRGWFEEYNPGPGFSNDEFFEGYMKGKGKLGSDFKNYYQGSIKMGDTPSMAYLLNGDPEKPTSPSWGGSFVPLPFSAFRSFRRHTSLEDSIPTFGVMEWTFTSEYLQNEEAFIWMEIDGQRIDGFVSDDQYHVRFVPKRMDDWHYTLHSSAKDLDGQQGSFRSTDPWPGSDHPENVKLSNWWSDDPSSEHYLNGHQGAKTVAKYRKEYLSDWAERLKWLE